jgi:uncharacterized protein
MIRQLSFFFALSYAISWLIWLPLYGPALGIAGLPVLPFHHALGAFGPLLAAFTANAVFRGKRVRGLLGSMFEARSVLMLLIALLAPFLLLLITLLISGDIQQVSLDDIGGSVEFPQWSMGLFFLYNVFTFGYGEETGWRGYALPLLQRQFNALNASLILTVFWAGWHWPLFLYRPGYTTMDIAGATGWLLSLLTGSVLLTWLYNSSKGSILVCAIFHATIDIAFTSKGINPVAMSYLGVLVTIWGILIVLLKKPKNLSASPAHTAGNVMEQ